MLFTSPYSDSAENRILNFWVGGTKGPRFCLGYLLWSTLGVGFRVQQGGHARRSQSLWFCLCPGMDAPDSCTSEPRSNMLPKMRTILRVKNIHNPCKLTSHDLTRTMSHQRNNSKVTFSREIYTSLNHSLPFHIPLPHLLNTFQKMKLGSYRAPVCSLLCAKLMHLGLFLFFQCQRKGFCTKYVWLYNYKWSRALSTPMFCFLYLQYSLQSQKLFGRARHSLKRGNCIHNGKH